MSPVFSQFVFDFLSSIRLSMSSIHLWPSIGSWLSLLERFPLIVPLFVQKCTRHAQKVVRWHGLHIKSFLQYQGKNMHTCIHTCIQVFDCGCKESYITLHINSTFQCGISFV